MKKLLALTLTLALVLSCLPGTALAEKYKSQLLKRTISLPSRIALVDEQPLQDGSGVSLTLALDNQPNVGIYTMVQKIPGFKGYTTATLPAEQYDAWTQYYYQSYPENASVNLLQPNSGSGDALYCYCGQAEDGSTLVAYISVNGPIYISSCSVSSGSGLTKSAMQAALAALNAVSAAVGKSSSGGTTGTIYRYDDYDAVIEFYLVEDDDDFDLYEDEDFDWYYVEVEWDEDDEEDNGFDLDDDDDDDDAEDSGDEEEDSGEEDGGYEEDGDNEDDSGEEDGGYEESGDNEDYGGEEDGGYEDSGEEE